MGDNSGKGRIEYLDGIRGVAIAVVVAFHWISPYAPLARGGYVGVDVFFVLSGYIITRILWRGRDRFSYPSFLRRRFLRLYPALVASVVIGSVAVIVLHAFRLQQTLGAAAAALTSTMSLAVGSGWTTGQPFTHTWSLSVEWVFYLVWPIALIAARRADPRRIAAVAAAIGAGLYVVASAFGYDVVYFSPLARCGQLLIGCAVALGTSGRLSDRPRRSVNLAASAGLAVIAVWTLAGPVGPSGWYLYLGFPLVTASAAALVAAGENSFVARTVLERRPVVAVGRASYSIYLWHVIPLVALDKDVLHVSRFVLGGAGAAAAIVASYASYRWLELPFMRSRTSGIERPITSPPDPLPPQRTEAGSAVAR